MPISFKDYRTRESLGTGEYKETTHKGIESQAKDFASQAKRGVDNASAAAGRWAGRALGTALGGVGGLVGGQIGDFIGRHARQIAQALGAYLIAQAVAGFLLTVVAAVILVIFTAFALFIINSGAYVVTPGSNISGGGGNIPIEGARVGCYVFNTSWNSAPNNLPFVQQAAQHILSRPGASARICAAGDVTVEYATGLTGGGIVEGSGIIRISDTGSRTATASRYTLAHESGHIIERRNPAVPALYLTMNAIISQDANREPHPQCDVGANDLLRYLPSYGCFDNNQDGVLDRISGLPRSDFEDRAEAIGLWLMLPQEHSVISFFGPYQTAFPGHVQFAEAVFSQ